jgi:hypothetical protein
MLKICGITLRTVPWTSYTLSVASLRSFVITYVLFVIMHANSAMDLLREGIVNSSDEDFSLIGARDNWIKFIDEAPCYWYIFGFAITKGWMIGFLSGGIAAVFGALIVSELAE